MWENNYPHGKGVKNDLDDGGQYEGEFVKGKMEGFGTYTYSSGCEYKGEFL